MKTSSLILTVLLVGILSTSCFAVFAYTVTGKTEVGNNNKLAWGTVTDIGEAGTEHIHTSLNAIRSCGVNVGSTETIASTEASDIIASATGGGGIIYVKCADATLPNGTWWAIGK